MKSKKPKILITEPEYFLPEFFDELTPLFEITSLRPTPAKLRQIIGNFDAIVLRVDTKLDTQTIQKANKLKCVISTTTGLNHLDLETLKARQIPIFSLHGTHSVSTAEHAISLLLSLARKIPQANLSMQKNRWHRWEFTGAQITGKTLGILGLGRIGSEVAQRAQGLGMKVISFDPYISAKIMLQKNVTKVDLDTLLTQSDFLTLHANLTSETKDMFSEKEFTLMKPNLILVNAARGEIINEQALLKALKTNQIQSAALDVYPLEPLTKNHPLRQYAKTHNNLILTPHIAATTKEAIAQANDFAAESLKNFFYSTT